MEIENNLELQQTIETPKQNNLRMFLSITLMSLVIIGLILISGNVSGGSGEQVIPLKAIDLSKCSDKECISSEIESNGLAISKSDKDSILAYDYSKLMEDYPSFLAVNVSDNNQLVGYLIYHDKDDIISMRDKLRICPSEDVINPIQSLKFRNNSAQGYLNDSRFNGNLLKIVNESYLIDIPDYGECNYTYLNPLGENETAYYQCQIGSHKGIAYHDVTYPYDSKELYEGGSCYDFYIQGNKKPNEKLDYVVTILGKDVEEAAWWNSSWARKKQITFTGVAALSNFTIYLNISATSSMNVSNGYSDLRFLNSSETGEYVYEIEWNNTNGAGVWVTIPSLLAGTNTLYMYYGNGQVQSTQNARNTWNYGGNTLSPQIVAHFSNYQNGTSYGTYDSSGHLNATVNVKANFTIPGVLDGTAMYLDGTANNAVVWSNGPYEFAGYNSWTASVWSWKLPPNQYSTWMNKNYAGNGYEIRCPNGDAKFQMNFHAKSNNADVTSTGKFWCGNSTDLTWTYNTIVHIGGTNVLQLYKNGVPFENDTTNPAMPTSAVAGDFIFGYDNFNAAPANGYFDEFKFFNNTAMSQSWVAQEYQNFNSSFITFGPEEIPLNCEFQGYVKDSAANALTGAKIIINLHNSTTYYNTTTNTNGFWDVNITVTGNYTVIAYYNSTLLGGAKPFIVCS